jgi:hypothetical protein
MILKIKASAGIVRAVSSIASEFINKQLSFSAKNYGVNNFPLEFVFFHLKFAHLKCLKKIRVYKSCNFNLLRL